MLWVHLLSLILGTHIHDMQETMLNFLQGFNIGTLSGCFLNIQIFVEYIS